jgi:hypothetical protein
MRAGEVAKLDFLGLIILIRINSDGIVGVQLPLLLLVYNNDNIVTKEGRKVREPVVHKKVCPDRPTAEDDDDDDDDDMDITGRQ